MTLYIQELSSLLPQGACVSRYSKLKFQFLCGVKVGLSGFQGEYDSYGNLCGIAIVKWIIFTTAIRQSREKPDSPGVRTVGCRSSKFPKFVIFYHSTSAVQFLNARAVGTHSYYIYAWISDFISTLHMIVGLWGGGFGNFEAFDRWCFLWWSGSKFPGLSGFPGSGPILVSICIARRPRASLKAGEGHDPWFWAMQRPNCSTY